MGWATCALALFNGRKRKAEIGIHMCVRMVRSPEVEEEGLHMATAQTSRTAQADSASLNNHQWHRL
jgi:hypothetical protein